jgi:hypothetical protein
MLPRIIARIAGLCITLTPPPEWFPLRSEYRNTTSGGFAIDARAPCATVELSHRRDAGAAGRRFPESSGLIVCMRVRGPMEQMPPLATKRVDDEGLPT